MEDTFRQVQNANRDEYQMMEGKEKTLAMEVVARGKEEIGWEKYAKKVKSLFNPVCEPAF
jgi:hypothetical protein